MTRPPENGGIFMTYKEQAAKEKIDWALNRKKELADQYNVENTAIVWIGGGRFIVCFGDGLEILA